MDASARWLNDYLSNPLSPEDQAAVLTAAAFPVETVEPVEIGDGIRDTKLVVEVTSNRGDCLSHIGLAREIAAATGQSLNTPAPVNQARGSAASSTVRVVNHDHRRCPVYTARVLRGVTVKPSPDWLAQRLRAIGQIPRNNIVDATNFVLFEMGQPTHIFDLAKIKGGEINIRLARPSERFLPIGEGEQEIQLTADDLVIADANDAVAIGGVKGGALSAVTNATRDLLIESATFAPVTVRTSARRHRIASASAFRFERGVHPGFVNAAAERLVELIQQVAGGELAQGVVSDGAPIPEARPIAMRPQRCRAILGTDLPVERMIDFLARLGFEPRHARDSILCTVPVVRLDIEREIDLIEEIARLNGYDSVPIREAIAVRVAAPQARVQGKRALADALAGMGYVETVTHSLISEGAANEFLHFDQDQLRIADQRAAAEPVLRPSILPSLLRVRRFNEDQGVANLALFEIASTFVRERRATKETQRLGLVQDVTETLHGLRTMRGAIERIVELLAGPGSNLTISPTDNAVSWFDLGAQAAIRLDATTIGSLGLIAPRIVDTFDLKVPIAAAEIDIDPLLARYPPMRDLAAMPAFPPIERDISAIVQDSVAWSEIESLIGSLRLDELESLEFVGTYRGKQIGERKKSLTLRLRFRAADRTLRHDEVDPQVATAMKSLEQRLGAAIRT